MHSQAPAPSTAAAEDSGQQATVQGKARRQMTAAVTGELQTLIRLMPERLAMQVNCISSSTSS